MLVQNYLTQKTKNIIFTLVILLLIASNLATLLSWRVHESMHNMISQTVSFFSTEMAKKVFLSSPKVHLELSVENRTKILSKNFQDQMKTMKNKEQNLLKKIATNGFKELLLQESLLVMLEQHLLNTAPEQVLGRNCRFLQGNETSPHDVKRISDALKNEKECSVNLLNYKKNGTKFVNEVRDRYYCDAVTSIY